MIGETGQNSFSAVGFFFSGRLLGGCRRTNYSLTAHS